MYTTTPLFRAIARARVCNYARCFGDLSLKIGNMMASCDSEENIPVLPTALRQYLSMDALNAAYT